MKEGAEQMKGNARNNRGDWVDDGLHYANKRFQRTDFSNRVLSQGDFKGSELIECDFSNSELSGAKFMGAQCPRSVFKGACLNRVNFADATLVGSDFSDADLRNVTLTMSPQTFEGVKLPKRWLNAFIFLLTLTRDLSEDARNQLIEIIGKSEFELLTQARQLL
jgi:uncharacterized protein YjbI with pentapeptide repeats